MIFLSDLPLVVARSTCVTLEIRMAMAIGRVARVNDQTSDTQTIQHRTQLEGENVFDSQHYGPFVC